MTEQANIVISIPAYISNDAADDSITITDPISGIKAIVLTTGYYEFQLNDATGDGTEATPFHLLKELADGSTTDWHYRITSDGKLAISYSGTGSATFVFENSHIQNLCGSTSSTLTFAGAGEQIMTYPVYGLLISRNREGDGSWRLDPGFNIHQITADNNVYGWSDDYNKYKRKFGLRFLPKDQSFKTSTQVGTPVYPVSSSTWNSGFNPLSYTAPFTAVNFLHNAKSRKLKMHLGSLPYNGTDEYFIVYQTPESIQRTNRFAPSLRANYERLLTLEDFEVLLSTGDTGEASYATGSLNLEHVFNSENLYAWYRGDLVTYTEGTNKVSVWPDKSGNGNHLSQSNSTYQPVYSASIASRNNNPGVHATSGQHLFSNNSFSLRTKKTIFYVVGSIGSMYYISTQYNSGVEYYYAYHPGTATFYNRNSTGEQHYITNTGLNFFQANTNHTFLYDNVTPQLFRSSSVVAGAVGGSAIGDSYNTGAFYLFSGFGGAYASTMQILEVLIFNKALNSTEMTEVWDYLRSRYGT